MLYKETIDSWIGLGAPTPSTAVLNTVRIFELKVKGSGASFRYSLDVNDRRDKPTLIWGDTSVANIKISFDSALTSNVMTLNVYPGDDVSENTTAKHIDYDEFVYAYAHEAGAANSWVVYDRGRVVVSETLDELVTAAYGS